MKVSVAVLLTVLFPVSAPAASARSTLQQMGEFEISEANQGVGVDDKYFYAVDNQTIAKYDKKTGELVKKWKGQKNGPIIHLDSALLMDGKIYCAHSNYNEWPMTSSVEIWDADTMEHIGNHSFGIHWGSLTWVDFYNGHWWMTFANYDIPYGPNKTPTATRWPPKWSSSPRTSSSGVLGASQDHPGPVRGHEQLRRFLGSRWVSLSFRPRPSGDLQDAVAQVRLRPRTR